MITYSEAQSMMRKASNRGYHKRRKLANNTYLYEMDQYPRASNGSAAPVYGVKLHNTFIIEIYDDGTFVLNTSGWETVTTKARLNDWSPARVYSVDGQWCIHSASDPKTPPKMQRCRTCKGSGQIHHEATYSHWDYFHNGSYSPVRLDPPKLISEAHDSECWRCNGTGQCDYGSKPRPVKFYDGIRVDLNGEVTDPNATRMFPTPEEIAARDKAMREEMERAARERKREQREARVAWFKRCKSLPNGEVIVYKAVDDYLCSGYGFAYPIGETVACDDWRPTDSCGHGLHFCARVEDARFYFPTATRYLACAVRTRDAVLIGGNFDTDKIKAPRARVLYEVNRDGDRLEECIA